MYDFAGRVTAKRVEFAPRTRLSSLAGRWNDGPAAARGRRHEDGERMRKLYEVGARVTRFSNDVDLFYRNDRDHVTFSVTRVA